MQLRDIRLQREMQEAVQALHQSADALITSLEAQPDLLNDDTADGDNARAALEGARAWRALIESPGIN